MALNPVNESTVVYPLPQFRIQPFQFQNDEVVQRSLREVLVLKPSQWQKDAKVSSFAIAMLALFFVGTALIGFGISSTPAIAMSGFSFLYQMASLHFVVIGLALFIIAASVKIASYRRCDQTILKAPSDPSIQNGVKNAS